MRIYLVFILFFYFSQSLAQYTHTFTQTARNTHYGNLRDIAIDTNGTIFLASDHGGLQVYNYNGESFNFVFQAVNDSCDAECITVGSDGTVFLATGNLTGSNRLFAYSYDGTSLNENANTLINGYPTDIAVGSDGTVYLANGTDGLYAYNYNGTSFTEAAHTPIDSGSANSIAIDADGTIFCSITGVFGPFGYIQSDDAGLYAFGLSDTSFVSIAHVDDNGWAESVAFSKDGTVFLANGTDGLRAYKLNDSSFTNIAHADIEEERAYHVAVSNDSTILLSSDYDLWAYTYDGSVLKETGHIYFDRHIYSDEIINVLAVDQTGLFYAITNFCLASYTCDEYALTNKTYSFITGIAHKVVQGTDGTIFLANGGGGLLSYIYNGISFINTAQIKDGDSAESVALDSEGTIFVSYANHSLWAYHYDGASFTTITQIDTGFYAGGEAFSHPYNNVIVGSNGTVFLSDHSRGLKVYEFDGNSFTRTTGYNYAGFFTEDGAIGPDGTLFLATHDGLSVFEYNGTSLNLIAGDFEHYRTTLDVALSNDGTVFVSAYNGIRAYLFNGTSLTNYGLFTTDNYYYHSPALTVGPDGTVFITNGYDGLHGFAFDGSTFSDIAKTASGSDGHDLIVGTDNTIFLANGSQGLIAYKFSKITLIENTNSYPDNYRLNQNYPNPFNPTTNIEFSIPKSEFVTLKVYNILGEEVTTLVSEKLSAGKYKYDWDASTLASGVYLYRIQAGDYVEAKKMLLMK